MVKDSGDFEIPETDDHSGSAGLIREANDRSARKDDLAAHAAMECRLKELNEDLAGQLSPRRRKSVEEQKEILEKYLRNEWSYVTQQFRPLPSDEKGDVDTVKKAIDRLVKYIGTQHAELAKHLSDSVTIRQFNCVYDPNPHEEWDSRID